MFSDKKEQLIIKKPKQFADEAIKRGAPYYDYENYQNLEWKDGSIYACEKKIGRGKYSQVFESTNLNNSEKCVVKMLKPIKFKKINRQIKILMSLNGKANTIKLLDLVKEGDIYCLILQYVKATDYKSLLPTLTSFDCKFYIYEILKGLHYCHSKGIMHRDIKPQNIVIDHENRKLRIIDWGLGEFYLPEKDYNVRVSSRYFKGPQLLVSYEHYHYSLDIWSLGVMMAGMIFLKEPFFKGSDNFDQLEQITKVLGTEELFDYIGKYNITLETALEKVLGYHKSIKLSSLINEKNEHLTEPAALDLLEKMMRYDHQQRPTAEECMAHPYFNAVRQ